MKFCMKCMAQYDDGLKVCPECGFAEGTMPDNSRCLEPGSVFADRYIIGMPLNIDGWFVKYIGWDALTNRTVTIYEYSPTRFSSRNIGDTRITIIKEKEFYKYMDSFMKKAQLLAELHLPENVSAVYETFEKNNTAYVVSEYVKGKPLMTYLAENGAVPPETAEQMFLPLLRSIDTLHDSGFVIGGFSPYDLLVLDDGTLFLNSYLENILFNVTDDLSDINQKEKQKFFPLERLKAIDSPELLPANDVYSAALIMHLMMGVKLPDAKEREELYNKSRKDKLKPLGAYHVKVSKDKENAFRNASYVETAFRTPDMESFIKELSGEKKVILRTKKNKGFPLWAKIAIPAACAAVIAGVVLAVVLNKKEEVPVQAAVTDALDPSMTVVPSLVNLSAGTAEQKLTQSGLLIEISGKEIHDDMDPDLVLAQTVEKGSMIERNSVVGVTLSARSGYITMPNFLGLESVVCIEAAENLGFSYSVTEAYSRSIEQGCIVSQSITPYEQVKTDRRLELVVSLGHDPNERIEEKSVELENLVGRSYNDFVNEAEQEGTPVRVAKKVYDDTKPEGTIINQYPGASTRQKNTDPVQLEVTTSQKELIVPDMTLLEQKRAADILALFGFEAEIKQEPSDTVAEGLVSVQEPAAGQTAPTGSKIVLTVSSGKATAIVPGVVGLQSEAAVGAILNEDFSPKITYGADGSKPDNEVLSQSIEGGTEAKKGTAVVLTVNSTKDLTEIPDVKGKNSEEALKTLEEAGFVMKIFTDGENTLTDGKIISQTPESGTLAAKDSGVTVLFGDGSDESKPSDESSEGDSSLDSVYETDSNVGADIVISPESITAAVDDEFVLKIKCIGIEDLNSVEYELSEQGIIEEKYIDKQTLDMTFKAVKPGSVMITITCGDIKRICFVEIKE